MKRNNGINGSLTSHNEAVSTEKIRRPDCPLKGTDRLRPCLQKDLSQVVLCPRILLIDLYIFDPTSDPVFFL